MKKITFKNRLSVGITDEMVFEQITKLIYSNHFNNERVDDLRDYCVDATYYHHFNTPSFRPISITEAISEFIWEFSNG